MGAQPPYDQLPNVCYDQGDKEAGKEPAHLEAEAKDPGGHMPVTHLEWPQVSLPPWPAAIPLPYVPQHQLQLHVPKYHAQNNDYDLCTTCHHA